MKSFLHDLNEEVITLSKEVGSFIAGEQQNITSADIGLKGLHDYVTHVDKTSEKRLVEGLSKILPGSGFLVEEGTVADAGNEYTWIVDPLDGTTNFIHGLPVFSISIALQQNGLTIMGLVYDIKAGECFYAIKGAGAHLNGKQISVSVIPGLSEALLATGFPYNDFSRQQSYLGLFAALMQKCSGIRRYGSAAIDLAWVACGRFDAFWEYSLKPWDVAAGAFIVQEAGGICGDFSGGDNFIHGKEIACGNPAVFGELIKEIGKYFK